MCTRPLCALAAACAHHMLSRLLAAAAAPVSYAIVGSPSSKGFNALNALGIIIFAYGECAAQGASRGLHVADTPQAPPAARSPPLHHAGNTILPEVQATLRGVPPSNITTRPMVVGTLAAFAVVLPMYGLVSVVGYLKFGNSTPSFLLQGLGSPAWLVALADCMCIVQLLIALQVGGISMLSTRCGPA